VENYRRNGAGIQSAVVVANNVYQKFDSVKKARLLRANQREIAAAAEDVLVPAGSSGTMSASVSSSA